MKLHDAWTLAHRDFSHAVDDAEMTFEDVAPGSFQEGVPVGCVDVHPGQLQQPLMRCSGVMFFVADQPTQRVVQRLLYRTRPSYSWAMRSWLG